MRMCVRQFEKKMKMGCDHDAGVCALVSVRLCMACTCHVWMWVYHMIKCPYCPYTVCEEGCTEATLCIVSNGVVIHQVATETNRRSGQSAMKHMISSCFVISTKNSSHFVSYVLDCNVVFFASRGISQQSFVWT